MGVYGNYFCEALLMNKKDIQYNVDEFKSGKTRILFILGLSGSGKSTLAEKYANDYKAAHIDLDDMVNNFDFTDNDLKEYDPKVAEFFKKHPEYRYSNKNEMLKRRNWGSLYDNLVNYLMDNSSTRYTIEGVELIDSITENTISLDKIKKYAIIINGASLALSQYRAYKRERGRENEKESIVDFLKYFSNNIKDKSTVDKQLEKIRRKI